MAIEYHFMTFIQNIGHAGSALLMKIEKGKDFIPTMKMLK